MRVNLVADVGNSRVKWGLCSDETVEASVSLPPEDPAAWQAQSHAWNLRRPLHAAVAGVHPERGDRLVAWLRGQGADVQVLDRARQLPLPVLLEHPDRVGIDRLLNAVSANTRRTAGVPAVIVDAGSAVTVDRVDADGAFRGGAILPGLRLMAQALYDYTALLPRIEIPQCPPEALGTRTGAAMEAGVFYAVVGGIQALVAKLADPDSPEVFLTGGDARALEPALRGRLVGRTLSLWPEMTLEGIRASAEALS